MTLIVLEIGVPDPGPIRSQQDLWEAIMRLSPRFVTYLLSFLTLGIFWNGQQTQLYHIARADRSFSWLQLAFLAAIALPPFSTSLLAEFISFRLALFVYWLNIFAGGALIYACWTYARRAGLVKPQAGSAVSRAITRRVIVAQSLYAFGALPSVINTYVSIAFIVLVQLNYALVCASRSSRGRLRKL